MAVLERYDSPFDRWKKHDHSRHLSVDVVKREDMHDATVVEKQSNASRNLKPKFEPTIEQKAAQRANETNVKLLWIIFSIVGVFNPVFMIIGYFMGRTVNRRVANEILVTYLVIVTLFIVCGILVVNSEIAYDFGSDLVTG